MGLLGVCGEVGNGMCDRFRLQVIFSDHRWVYKNGFQKKIAQLIVESNAVKLLIFDPESEVIERWIN
ncbi:MAG: hypothetical protein EAZ09_17500 [Oscillatoriales cyanobacterium]|nr:MAG: hypothetical protein EAZ18_16495 [Oscillatoriales cyanobacterium]TAH18824.1 MAG: hypothetical protein EAZ09_17500 [Oscillatoriales cyanobacterium]